jgi:RND family efflux transporter MFP subunit
METTQRPPAPPAPDWRPPDAQQGQHDPHDPHAEAVIPKDLPVVPTWAMMLVGVVAVGLLAAIFVIGWIPHRRQQAKLDAKAAELKDARPIVTVVRPLRMDAVIDLTLPGDARAMQETSLFPRTNGYLKHWYVDIGDHVNNQQVLAEIDTPEVDAELAQARASWNQATANLTRAIADDELAQTTAVRYKGLIATGGVTKQDLDEKQSAANQSKAAREGAQANVAAAQAAVDRLAAMQGFEKVIAPFSGTITARNYDDGALLSATDTVSGHEMFRLADTDTLRVFVNVPQGYSTLIHTGTTAAFTVSNYPAREFPGLVTRSAGAIDPATRTLSMEVDVPNKEHALWAGMYGQIKFHITQPTPPLMIPSSAMLFGQQGTQVAVVKDAGNHPWIHFQDVHVGRDLGAQLEVNDGLTGDEEIVANPGEHLAEKGQVQVGNDLSPQGSGEPPETAQAK